MSDPNDPFKDDADSVYRTPESDTTQALKGDLLAAFLGPKNAEYYAQRFRRFEEENTAVSWNWPAFFVTFPWLLYRKMWLNAALYFFVMPTVYVLLLVGLIAVLGYETGTALYYLLWFLTGFLGIPLFANWLYYRHAQGKLQKATMMSASPDQQALQLARTGGTSSVIVILLPLAMIFIVGILAAIAIPAYQDFTIRAQVSEGLNLSGAAKAAVTDRFQSTGELAANNEIAGLLPANRLTGKYVSSVAVDAGNVVITYGNQANALIDGQTIVLTPEIQPNNLLNWACSSQSIRPAYLPAACR
jgi:Tfp pilus assembly major pilin PilA